MSTLPLVRRVVTGHNAQGQAVVIADGLLEGRMTPRKTSSLTLIWTTDKSPVDNDEATDGAAREVDLVLPGGSVLRAVDMLPGTTAPMHRTSSIDYGIVVSGSIELLLDDGSATLVEQGGVVIQRGTMHSWRNPSDTETARVMFALLDATAATHDGAPLPEVHPTAARP